MKKMQFAEYKKIALSALKMQWTYNKRLMIREIILKLAEKLFFYGEIFCTGRVLDIIVGSRSGDFTTVLMFILLVFSIKFFEKAFQAYSNFKRSLEQYDADEKLREKRIDKISRIRMDYYESNDLYRNNSDISSFSSSDIDMIFDYVVDVPLNILNIIIMFVAMINISPIICVAFIALYTPICLIEQKMGISWIKFIRSKITLQSKLQALFDFVASRTTIQELKLFNSFDYIIEQRKKLFGKIRDESIRFNLKQTNIATLLTALPLALYYGMYFVLALSVCAGKMIIGDFWIAVNLAAKLNDSLSSASSSVKGLSRSCIRFKNYIDFFESEEERTNGKKLPKNADIVIKNLTYSYPESENNALDHLNMTIKNGKRTAIVGYNGAGKTTLSKIIVGLYNNYDGDVCFGDVPAREIANRDIYNAFSVAFQEYCKYPFGIRENITLSADVDESRYADVLRRSGCDKLAEELLLRDETPLNKEYDEGGTDLSEGQWHRLMLARTLYHGSRYVLFDEPTASLDPLIENRFINDILEQSTDQTVIMITHRLICMPKFDNIIVLDNGAVAEQGTHAELLKKKGIYYKMWSAQAEKYTSV